MKNIEIGALKYKIAIFLVCALFTLLVWQAFNYLPEEDLNNESLDAISTVEEVIKEDSNIVELSNNDNNDSEDFNNEEVVSVSQEVASKQKVQTRKFDVIKDIDAEFKMESIDINKTGQNNDNENFFNQIEEFKKDQNFSEAISIYKQMISMTDDREKKALYSSEIAILYAKMKRYGSAISYAQQAFNLKPTTEREVLLARLYYKVGESDKAQERINNVLKRDF